MLTCFALVKESNRFSIIQERKIMFFTAVIQGCDGRFLLEVFEELLDLRTFCPMELSYIVRFLNEYSGTFCDYRWSN